MFNQNIYILLTNNEDLWNNGGSVSYISGTLSDCPLITFAPPSHIGCAVEYFNVCYSLLCVTAHENFITCYRHIIHTVLPSSQRGFIHRGHSLKGNVWFKKITKILISFSGLYFKLWQLLYCTFFRRLLSICASFQVLQQKPQHQLMSSSL